MPKCNRPSLSFLKKFIFISIYIFISSPLFAKKNIHEPIFTKNEFPSANDCKSCHPIHYKEWSVSSHAYAQLSPVAMSLQAAVTKLTNGTNGDFCIRCHNQVGMNQSEPIFIPNADRSPISREGVTCVVCHRRKLPFGKVNGRFGLVKGDLFEPIYGPNGGDELKRIITSDEYDINIERGKPGRAIHTDAKKFFQMNKPGFCGSCHDVTHINGFRFEEAFSEYKASPAAKKGITCQDCHMGKTPGIPSGYLEEPVAIIGGKPSKTRKRTVHMFVGPDSSIVHPGIFPHNPEAQKIASLRQWLTFEYRAGWGTDEFEDNISNEKFPPHWTKASDRYEARDIIEENLQLLNESLEQRKILLRNGYSLGKIIVDKVSSRKIQFRVEVKNITEGHNIPTGFDAERVVFLQITVKDKNEKIIFKSGDLDPNGDVRDLHSIYVHNGELPLDKYLFNLQSKFLLRMIRGGEREQVLPINHSIDPLPFLRPPTHSTILLGRPANLRKHRKTIRAMDSKWAKYKINRSQLKNSQGPFRANIKLIAGMLPANLVYTLKDFGFDEYNLSAHEVAKRIVDAHIILWERNITLEKGTFKE